MAQNSMSLFAASTSFCEVEAAEANIEAIEDTDWCQMEAIVLRSKRAGLGFSIMSGRQAEVVVDTILPKGVAAKDGRLRSGDTILAIDDHWLQDAGCDLATSMLGRVNRHMCLLVTRAASHPEDPLAAAGAHILPASMMLEAKMAPKSLRNMPHTEVHEVELVKDGQGQLGITVVGYTCECWKQSGLFVKSVMEVSSAELSKKVAVNDQIVEIDGKAIPSGTYIFPLPRSSGKVVRMKLVRYIQGLKFEQISNSSNNNQVKSPPKCEQLRTVQPKKNSTFAQQIEPSSRGLQEDSDASFSALVKVARKAVILTDFVDYAGNYTSNTQLHNEREVESSKTGPKLLIDRAAYVNKTNEYGSTPLLSASSSSCSEIVQLLIKNGADVNFSDGSGTTPLHSAGNSFPVVQLLIEGGADVNKADLLGNTLLYTACAGNWLSIAQVLIEHGADVNRATKIDGNTPLLLACIFYSGLSLHYLLIEHGADVNKANINGSTPLLLACQEGKVKAAQLLIEHGADVNKANINGSIPLHHACKKGSLLIAQLLSRHGAVINRADDDGRTPFYMSVFYGRLDIVQFLFEREENADVANSNGQISGHESCEGGNREFEKFDTKALTKIHGLSPFHSACLFRCTLEERLI